MAKGDVQQTPWIDPFPDTQGRAVTITVNFDNTTRLLANTGTGAKCVIIHRDNGCAYHSIVFYDEATQTKAVLAAPADGAGDNSYTVTQVRNATKGLPGFPQGFQTIEDCIAADISADF